MQNAALLDLSRQILTLTREVHSLAHSLAGSDGDRARLSDSDRTGR